MTKLEKIEQSLAIKDRELSSVRHTVIELQQELREKQAQLDWFKKQLFGQRSEKQRYIDEVQHVLFANEELAKDKQDNTTAGTTVAAHTRRSKKQRNGSVTDEGLRFDENVPVIDVEHECAELDGADANDYEIVRYE